MVCGLPQTSKACAPRCLLPHGAVEEGADEVAAVGGRVVVRTVQGRQHAVQEAQSVLLRVGRRARRQDLLGEPVADHGGMGRSLSEARLGEGLGRFRIGAGRARGDELGLRLVQAPRLEDVQVDPGVDRQELALDVVLNRAGPLAGHHVERSGRPGRRRATPARHWPSRTGRPPRGRSRRPRGPRPGAAARGCARGSRPPR